VNTQDDPRFANFKFPGVGYTVEHWNDAPPEVKEVRLLAYDLAGSDCTAKTIMFRTLDSIGGQRVRCSSEMVFVSFEEAREHIRKEMEDAVQSLKEELERRVIEIADQMKVCKDWLRDNPKPNET